MPTADRDSGHRSRTSKTNGTRLARASHHPVSPTKSWGDVAITASGQERNNPEIAAETENDTKLNMRPMAFRLGLGHNHVRTTFTPSIRSRNTKCRNLLR